MADTIWIARHGNRQDFVDADWPKTAERPYDPGLSPDGIEQAKRLAQRMRREHVSAIVASPFLRTVETAHHVARVLDVPIYLEPGLSEWFNEEWFPHPPVILPHDRLIERFPHVDLSYQSSFRPLYPESEVEAMRRSAEAAHAVVQRFPEPVLIVGHGVSVAGAAMGLDPDVEVLECGLCALFKLVQQHDSWTTELCGDVSHLDDEVAANRYN